MIIYLKTAIYHIEYAIIQNLEVVSNEMAAELIVKHDMRNYYIKFIHTEQKVIKINKNRK